MLQNKFKIIGKSAWVKDSNGVYGRIIKIIFYDDFFDVYVSALNAVKQVCTSYKNVVEEKFSPRHREKGEKLADYVASMAGLNPNATQGSHYSDSTIDVTLPDGKRTHGKIRVSDHITDSGVFAKNNDVDVCISIVVGEVERKYSDNEFENGREITIYEYVLDKKYENKETILINIADKIVQTMLNGWTENSDMGIKNAPNKKKVIGTKIQEERIREIVREEIEKYFKN